MVSLFYPAARRSSNTPLCLEPYAPPATLTAIGTIFSGLHVTENFTDSLKVPLACNNHTDSRYIDGIHRHPVVVFSPGHLVPRFVYTAIVLELASQGIVVASIDHPSDGLVVEFPDGSVVPGIPADTDAKLDVNANIRTQDVSFLLDQLAQSKVIGDFIPGATRALNVSRVVVYGQSLGGATAIRALIRDHRVVGAVNLDGRLAGQDGTQAIPGPFILWGDSSVNSSSTNMTSWANALDNTKGWARELSLMDSVHMTFSDEALIATMAGTLNVSAGIGADIDIGNIDGTRVTEILGTYLKAFIDYAFGECRASLLDCPSPKFPEVVFLQRQVTPVSKLV